MTPSRPIQILLIATYLICAPSLGHCQKKQQKLQDHLNACQESIDKNDYVTAIAECREVINVDPKNAAAYNNIGLAYAAAGDPSFALKNADQAVLLDPSKADHYGNRAVFETRLGYYGEAFADYAKAIELNPNQASFYLERGLLNQQIELTEMAFTDFKKAIELDPNTQLAYKGLAKIYNKQGNMKEFLVNADQFLEYQPDDVEILTLRGKTRKIKHDQFEPTNEKLLTDALADCTRAVEKEPGNGRAHACLASVYLSGNQFDDSIASATKAIELNFFEGVYATRAIAHFKLHEYKQAFQDVAYAQQQGETVNPKFLEDLNKKIDETKAAVTAVKAKEAQDAKEAADKKAAEEKAAKEAAEKAIIDSLGKGLPPVETNSIAAPAAGDASAAAPAETTTATTANSAASPIDSNTIKNSVTAPSASPAK